MTADVKRVVLMEDYLDYARHTDAVKALAQRVDLRIYTDKARDDDELLRRLEGAQVAITIRDRVMFHSKIFERVRGLQLLSVCGPRLAPHIDLPAATRAGVPVCCAPADPASGDAHHATAELTLTLILGLVKSVEHNQRVMRAGGWQTRIGTGLRGHTLGVVGSTGKVGRLVTEVAKALGMRVLAYSPRLTAERAAQQGVEAVSLEALLRQSDVVTLHANATPETAGMLGAAQFNLMKPGAFLVNTARAALIDEAALREALDSGRLAGAGLDVYWQEPLPADHWARQHPGVLMQPHMGAFTPEGYGWIVTSGVTPVLQWLDGKPIPIANPEAQSQQKETSP